MIFFLPFPDLWVRAEAHKQFICAVVQAQLEIKHHTASHPSTLVNWGGESK